MRSTFVGGLLVEGVDDPDDIVSHVSIDIAGPASETHSGEEGASPCAASASDATGKSVVTAEDLAALEERVSTLLHVHSNEFRAVDARVAQLEQMRLAELMATAAASAASSASAAAQSAEAAYRLIEKSEEAVQCAAEVLAATRTAMNAFGSEGNIQSILSEHCVNAALSARNSVLEAVDAVRGEAEEFVAETTQRAEQAAASAGKRGGAKKK